MTAAARLPRSGLSVALLLLALTGLLATRASAQQTLVGRVLAADTPAAGLTLTLHRVSPTQQGPVATTRSDERGGFRFRLPPPDTAAAFTVFLVTTEYRGVRYFGPAVHASDLPPDYHVEVFDTVSGAAGRIRAARRDVLLAPDSLGGWRADEVLRLHNTGRRTLVSHADAPAWEIPLPPGTTDLEANGGTLSADQLRRVGDRAFVLLSLPPGEREIALRYRFPGSPARTRLALGGPTDTLNLFVRQPAPRLRVSGMRPLPPFAAEGEDFLHFAATGLRPGSLVSLEWERPAGHAALVIGLAGAALLLLAVGLLLRRRRGAGRG